MLDATLAQLINHVIEVERELGQIKRIMSMIDPKILEDILNDDTATEEE